MDLAYIGSLSVVNALLIGQIQDTESFSDHSDPQWITVVIRFLHSVIFWSQFYSLLSGLVSVYVTLHFQHEKVHTFIPTVYFFGGMTVFVFWSFWEVVIETFALRVAGGTLQDVPVSLRLPNYLAYTIPQVLLTLSFVLSVLYLVRSVRRASNERANKVVGRRRR